MSTALIAIIMTPEREWRSKRDRMSQIMRFSIGSRPTRCAASPSMTVSSCPRESSGPWTPSIPSSVVMTRNTPSTIPSGVFSPDRMLRPRMLSRYSS